jgi:uroporphyrin-3 C-methyltransferase
LAFIMSENDPNLPVPYRWTSRFAAWRNPWLIVALLALALAGWQWLETRTRLSETQAELARRLSEGAAANQESRNAARQAQEQVVSLQAKVAAVEAKLGEFQGQTAALQKLYQDLAMSRDDATLLEIEQAVTLAAQQLQLSGNVQVAVLALQTADAKLARLDRPQFIAVRKALGRDLDRLRALPFVDVAGISLKLENIVASVDAMPLAMDERPRPAAKPKPVAAAPELPWWQRVSSDFWEEIKSLVRIQRFDRAEPVLLAPGQSFFLRDNLKLRLLNARLALLSHDQWTFRNDLKTARDWLERHFDSRDKAVQGALTTVRQLSTADINIELPNLNESLSAVRSFKTGKERK